METVKLHAQESLTSQTVAKTTPGDADAANSPSSASAARGDIIEEDGAENLSSDIDSEDTSSSGSSTDDYDGGDDDDDDDNYDSSDVDLRGNKVDIHSVD